MSLTTRLAYTVVAFTTIFGVVGCKDSNRTPASGNQEPGAVAVEPTVAAYTAAQMQVEFRQAQQPLMLPAGVRWPSVAPEAPPAPDNKGIMRGNSYEPGYGTSLAEGFWFCVWEREWLQQRTRDPARADTALATANRIKTMHLYRAGTDDSGRKYWDSLLQTAGLGDPTQISNDVSLNCSTWFNP